MIWKLCHYLFGWHYVGFHWGFGDVTICRVKNTPNGKPYITWCGQVHFLDESGRKFTPLTWDEKPFRGEEKAA